MARLWPGIAFLFAILSGAEAAELAPTVDPAIRNWFTDKYLPAAEPKALAISVDGLRRSAVFAGKRQVSLDELSRIAVERCQFEAKAPCYVAAVGDSVSENSQPANVKFVASGMIEAGRLPFLLKDIQERLLADYSQLPYPRALAIGPSGAYAFMSGDGARQKALRACKARDSHCFEYALDDTVVMAGRVSLSADLLEDRGPVPECIRHPVFMREQQGLRRLEADAVKRLISVACLFGGTTLPPNELVIHEVSAMDDDWLAVDFSALGVRRPAAINVGDGRVTCGQKALTERPAAKSCPN